MIFTADIEMTGTELVAACVAKINICDHERDRDRDRDHDRRCGSCTPRQRLLLPGLRQSSPHCDMSPRKSKYESSHA